MGIHPGRYNRDFNQNRSNSAIRIFARSSGISFYSSVRFIRPHPTPFLPFSGKTRNLGTRSDVQGGIAFPFREGLVPLGVVPQAMSRPGTPGKTARTNPPLPSRAGADRRRKSAPIANEANSGSFDTRDSQNGSLRGRGRSQNATNEPTARADRADRPGPADEARPA